jgi:hypothetical protein
VGGLGEAQDGRRRAAHGGPGRRPEAHGGGGVPACGGGKGRAGRLQWRTGKVGVLSIWGGSERRGGLHGDRAHGGNNGGGKLLYARGEGLERPFIGNRSGKGEHGKLGSGLGLPPGEMNLGGAAATETPASGPGSAQAPWCAGRAPTGGVRAVDGRGNDAWTGVAQEMAGGGQKRCITPVAEVPGEQSRGGAEAPGGRRGRTEPGTALQF